MRKKLIPLILIIVFAFSMLTGCGNLVVSNYQKNNLQVIAKIAPITKAYVDSNQTKTYQTEAVKIYKKDLYSQLETGYSNYMQNNAGKTVEQAVNYFVERLVIQELILIEADHLINYEHKLFLKDGQDGRAFNDINALNKYKYQTIGDDLFNRSNSIREDNGLDAIVKTDFAAETTPTYPLKPSYLESDEEIDELTEWKAAEHVSYVGDIYQLEAMKQLAVSVAKDAVGDKTVSAAEKEQFVKEQKKIKDMIADNKGIKSTEPAKINAFFKELYLYVGESAIIQHLIGESYYKNIKMQRLVEYLVGESEPSNEDIKALFDAELQKQKIANKVDSTYASLVKGSEPVLYTPNSNYYYVRHILIPFTDAQKEEIKTYTDPDKGRAEVAKKITGYTHVDGEDDKSKPPKSIDAIYEEVRQEIASAGNIKAADRKFIDLIFKYNTDTGIFDSAKGYSVAPFVKPEETGYVKEFALAAKALKDQYDIDGKLGTINKAITEFGCHIMFLADVPEPGKEFSLKDFVAKNEYQTFSDLFKVKAQAKTEEAVFAAWQDQNINHYLKDTSKVVAKFPRTYKEIWENNQ